MLRDSRGARGGPASNPLQNSNCWPRYVCAELQAYPQKSGNHHVVPAVAIINWESYMFVLSRQGGSVGSATATDDAPPMRQHTQICAQQRLRAGSQTWQSSRQQRPNRPAAGERARLTPHINPTSSDHPPSPTGRISPKINRNIEHWWYDRSPANWSATIP